MQSPESAVKLEPSQSTIAPHQENEFWDELLPELEEPTDVVSREPEAAQPQWLEVWQQHSQVLLAAIAPQTLALEYATDSFAQLLGGVPRENGVATQWLDRLAANDRLAVQQLYRRHIIYAVLRAVCPAVPAHWRGLEQTITVHFPVTDREGGRFVLVWLRSAGVQVTPLATMQTDWSDWQQLSEPEIIARLSDPQQWQVLEQQLSIDRYNLNGVLFLEGVEITLREKIRRLTHLLIDRESILRPEKFQQVNQALRSLFRADNSIILSAEGEQARLFIGNEYEELEVAAYAMKQLQGSHFLRAAEQNRIWNVSDLSVNCQTECEQH